MNPYTIQTDDVSSAENDALSVGAEPADLLAAKSQLGKQEYINYCETFVEKATGSGNEGATADQAFYNQPNAVHDPTLQGAKPGDEVYLSDPTNPAGHTGIMDTGGNFISATDNGVQENNLSDWERETNQTPLGYIPQKQNPYMIQASNVQPIGNPYMIGGQNGSN